MFTGAISTLTIGTMAISFRTYILNKEDLNPTDGRKSDYKNCWMGEKAKSLV